VPAWVLVQAISDDGRYIDLEQPMTTYPGAEIRLYVRNDRVAVGLFRPPVTGVAPDVAAMAAQPVVELTEVTELDVWTHAPPLPPSSTLAIVVQGRPARDVDPAELDGIVEQHDRRMRGWLVRDVLAQVVPNVRIAKLKIVGQTELDVSATDLAQLALLKRNQRGELVFQMWEAGAEKARVQVRGVKRLVIEAAK
jgi:hypothetical protein